MKKIFKFDVALVLSVLPGTITYYVVYEEAYEVTLFYPAFIWGVFWVLGVAFGVYVCSDSIGFKLPRLSRKRALVTVLIIGTLYFLAHTARMYSAPFDNYFCEGSGLPRFGKYGQMEIIELDNTTYNTGVGTYYYARPNIGCLDPGVKIEGPVDGVNYKLPSLRPDIWWTVFKFEVTEVPTTINVTDGRSHFPITIT